MTMSEDLSKKLNLLYNISNDNKFNKLICTFYKKDDLQYIIHNTEPNVIKNIYYKRENGGELLYYCGTKNVDLIKLNYYAQNNVLLYTFFSFLPLDFEVWFQLGFGDNFKIEFYE